jgi:hypothetical protein
MRVFEGRYFVRRGIGFVRIEGYWIDAYLERSLILIPRMLFEIVFDILSRQHWSGWRVAFEVFHIWESRESMLY